jgi:hypothetical protein
MLYQQMAENLSKWAKQPIYTCDVCHEHFNQIILYSDGLKVWLLCKTCRHSDDFLIEQAYYRLHSRSSTE